MLVYILYKKVVYINKHKGRLYYEQDRKRSRKIFFVTLVFVTQFANATIIQAGDTSTSCGASAITNVINGQYLGCSGAYSGNDATSSISSSATAALAGFSDALSLTGDWGYDGANKSDAGGNGIFTDNPETNDGTLALDTIVEGLFAVSIKAANFFSVFFFDGSNTGALSFDFTTNGVGIVGNGNAAALSHASYFSFANDDSGGTGGVTVNAPAMSLMMVLLTAWLFRRKMSK